MPNSAAWLTLIFVESALGTRYRAQPWCTKPFCVSSIRKTSRGGIAAHMMRRILVDHARSRQASKRGAGISVLSLDDVVAGSGPRNLNLLVLDQALENLARIDPQQSRIVELRFFAGLSIHGTAEVLKISPATVKREWAMAKAWLYREMSA